MDTMLDEAINEVKKLPKERQDELAEFLLAAAANDLDPYILPEDDRAVLKDRGTQAGRGEFATDREMDAVWKSFGL